MEMFTIAVQLIEYICCSIRPTSSDNRIFKKKICDNFHD